MPGGGAEGGERESSAGSTRSAESPTQAYSHNCEILTWAEIKSWRLNPICSDLYYPSFGFDLPFSLSAFTLLSTISWPKILFLAALNSLVCVCLDTPTDIQVISVKLRWNGRNNSGFLSCSAMLSAWLPPHRPRWLLELQLLPQHFFQLGGRRLMFSACVRKLNCILIFHFVSQKLNSWPPSWKNTRKIAQKIPLLWVGLYLANLKCSQ